MKKIFTLLFVIGAFIAKAGTPTSAPKAPTLSSSDVLSLFSDAYTNVTVTTWRTSWSSATLTDTMLSGDAVKRYSNLDFVGIEAVNGNSINASAMKYFHVDMWTGNATTFKIKLVDFGSDDMFGGGDDSEHELTFNSPAQDEWISYHIDLADFSNMTGKNNISQIIFAAVPSGTADVWIDNVYFTSKALAPPLAEPTVAAMHPKRKQADVISLYSDTFTNVTVDTYRTSWSAATQTEVKIDTNNILKYSALDFVGIETVGPNLIDAKDMEHFNMDIWSPNSTKIKIKIVDFGADGMFQGGDDSEHEIVIDNPKMEEWVNLHIPLTDFTGLTGKSNIAQIIIVSEPTSTSILYVDNIHFSKESGVGISKVSFDAIEIYPNPAKDVLNVNIEGGAYTISNISVMDQQGKVLMLKNINRSVVSETIDLGAFEQGLYYLNVNTASGSYVQKIFVQ